MIQYDIYPDMKRRCVVFGFEGGHGNDERLLKLLDDYRLKSTVYLNKWDKVNDIEEQMIESVHFKNAVKICDRFLENMKFLKGNAILFIYGRSSEISSEEDWENIESIFKKISKNRNIWYATYDEICEYKRAQKELIISEDEMIFYNPSSIDVWIQRDHTESMCIPAGGRINVRYLSE